MSKLKLFAIVFVSLVIVGCASSESYEDPKDESWRESVY